ncbi:MAG: protein kinase [Myxococcales bacterium]|nr:protein kinase [Myxococcales bacterium]MCB9542603.1 protein kinase [Myxococcales bacterium]
MIGKYPITRLMSAGGMGLIYEAVHPVLGTRVVIKTIQSHLAHDPQIIDRFFKEALATSRIRDERLPQIYDQDRLDDKSPYIVMEYLDGEDLASRLARGPLPFEYATRVIVEILEVLHRVHQLDIVHRDIKPQNIFLARSNLLGEVPKLLDFGVAHFIGEQATAPGEMMGTPLYMALEQAEQGGRIGPWTDVFSTGVMLYECLAGLGQRPWGSPNVMGYLARLKTGTAPRRLSELAPQTPPGLVDAVHTALAIRHEDRFPDADRFARALEPFAQPRAALFVGGADVTIDARAAAPRLYDVPSGRDDTVVERPDRITAPPATSASARTMTAQAINKLSSRLRLLGPGRSTTGTIERLKPGERRYVTLLAISMQIQSSLPETEPEDFDTVADQVFEVLQRVLQKADAQVEAPVGWSLIATFGAERTREDDAERAIGAAHRLIAQQRAVDQTLTEYGYGLSLRVGVHSGFVTRATRAGREVVTGDTAEVARHLALAAPINGICASRETLAIVGTPYRWRPMGTVEAKGRPRPVEAYEVIREGLSTDFRTRPGAARTFVGRGPAFDVLEHEYLLASVPSGEVRLIHVVGPAGEGKSRLLDEFVRWLHDDPSRHTKVVRAQPVGLHPYGVWASLLRQILFDTDDVRAATGDVVARLTQLAGALDPDGAAELRRQASVARLILGRGETDAPEQTDPEVFGVRLRSLLALTLTAAARRTARIHDRPLVVVLDDMHRADPTSVEVLGHIPGLIRTDVPPLFLIGARATSGRLDSWVKARELSLGPLPAEAVDRLIDEVAGVRTVSDAVRALVRGRAGGNPLFVEEMVQMLRARRQLDADEAALADLGPPGSLYGLLLSRLDRLPGDLRTTVQWLSVSGADIDPRVWTRVARRLGEDVPRRLSPETELEALAEQGVLEPAEIGGRFAYRFRQPLLRDAVYSTVLPHNRRLLHLAHAEVIEGLYPEPDPEQATRLLHHYSHTDREDKTVHFARLVGRRRLALAAHAEALSALQLAAMLQDRLATPDHEAAVTTLLDLSRALFYLGRLDDSAHRANEALGAAPADASGLAARAHAAVARAAQYQGKWEPAQTHLEQAEHLYERAARPLDAARARCMLAFVIRSRGGSVEEALELARSGWAVLRDGDAAAAVVRAGHDLGNILRDLGRYDEAVAVFDHAIARGRRASGDAIYARLPWFQACRSGRAICLAALGRLDEAIAEQRHVYEDALQTRHRVAQAVSAFHLARHLADAGDHDAAREMAESSLAVCGEVGMPGRAMKARLLLARLADAAGDPARQREHLEAAEFLARDGDLTVWFQRTVKPLVAVLRRLGELDRAAALLDEARRRATEEVEPALVAEADALRRAARQTAPPPPPR